MIKFSLELLLWSLFILFQKEHDNVHFLKVTHNTCILKELMFSALIRKVIARYKIVYESPVIDIICNLIQKEPES